MTKAEKQARKLQENLAAAAAGTTPATTPATTETPHSEATGSYEELPERPVDAASHPFTPEVLAAILAADDARASFVGVYSGRAYFKEQKYATRLRRSLEDGRVTIPSTRKSRHVDLAQGELLAVLAGMVSAIRDYDEDAQFRVPRAIAELAKEDAETWHEDYATGALADAQADLLSEAKETSRAAGERTGASESLTQALTQALVACKGTMGTVADCQAAREALRAAYEPFKDGSTLAKRMLVDF